MPTSKRPRRHPREPLRELEQEVESPIIPGELGQWCARVRRRLAAVNQTLAELDRNQKDVLLQTVAEDPALQPRARALDDKRTASTASLEDLRDRLDRLTSRLGPAEETSEEPVGAGEELREALLAWIVEARATDREIEGWLEEALMRDRGVVD